MRHKKSPEHFLGKNNGQVALQMYIFFMEMQRKGGYNRRNFLLKVQRVNEVYMEYSGRGIFAEHIFRNYIRDQFLISRSTFFQYLTIPYKRELEKLGEKEKERQLGLNFDNEDSTH